MNIVDKIGTRWNGYDKEKNNGSLSFNIAYNAAELIEYFISHSSPEDLIALRGYILDEEREIMTHARIFMLCNEILKLDEEYFERDGCGPITGIGATMGVNIALNIAGYKPPKVEI